MQECQASVPGCAAPPEHISRPFVEVVSSIKGLIDMLYKAFLRVLKHIRPFPEVSN
jgi:hypothetical protein